MKNSKYSFRALITLIKRYPIYLVIEVVSALCMVVQALIPIKVTQYVVASFENNLDYKTMVFGVLIYIAILIIAIVINNLIAYFKNYIKMNFTIYVATSLFKKLDEIDYDFHESNKFLDNYTRALESGADNIYNTATNVIALAKSIIQSISVFTVILQIHYLGVVYSVFIGIIYAIFSFRISKIDFARMTAIRPFMRMRWYIGRVYFVKESMADIKTTNIDDVLLDKHDQLTTGMVKTFKKYIAKSSCLRVIANILINSIYPVIVGIVAYVTKTTNNFADLASLTVAAGTLSGLVSTVVNYISEIQTTSLECKVPFDVLDMKSKIEGIKLNDVPGDFNKLELNDVTFAYTDKPVLKNINMVVNKGEKIAIVGANGAGKTTMVKLLLRLYDVNSGTIKINGQDFTQTTTTSLRQHIGAVFQNNEVYSVSVAENILLKKLETKEEEKLVIEALKFSGIYDYVMTLEKGINTMVTREFHRRGTVFSGGQTQKIAVARGYAQNYQLFILDEPSSALDPLAEAQMYHNMLELGNDKTLIFISHRLSATANVDRIYLVNNGKIEESGTHEQLMSIENGLYKKMFISQSEKYERR